MYWHNRTYKTPTDAQFFVYSLRILIMLHVGVRAYRTRWALEPPTRSAPLACVLKGLQMRSARALPALIRH